MDSRVFSEQMLDLLGKAAPGTELRVGLDRVLEAGRGGLIVIGDAQNVADICSGGFSLDAPFSPQKLSELSKMDGAIILDSQVSKIVRANVHLVPDQTVVTRETGTRHRTAERVAKSLQVPVIAISESRNNIHMYLGDQIRPILSASRLLERANQAIQTLERYKTRLDLVSRNLSMLEVEDLVSLRDVLEVVQRAEMVKRISAEIERNLIELGADGRLIKFQLDELLMGVDDDRRLLLRDYLRDDANNTLEDSLHALGELSDEELFDDASLAAKLQIASEPFDVDELLAAKGFRLLSKLPRINVSLIETLVAKYGDLRHIVRADSEELAAIDEVGQDRAQALKEGSIRLVENAFFDRL